MSPVSTLSTTTETPVAAQARPPSRPDDAGAATSAGVQPQAVAPRTADKRVVRVERTKPTRQLQPGDLVCGQCGEGNAPTRKFCSRCGTSLEQAVEVKPAWWRRFVPHRRARTAAAGHRPGAAKGRKRQSFLARLVRLRPIIAVIAVLIGLVYASYSPFREGVNERATSAREWAWSLVRPEFDPVRAVGAQASAERPEHTGLSAVDGFNNTFWQFAAEPSAIVRVDFAEPVDLDKAIVWNGASGDFQAQGRVRQVHLVYSTGESFDLELKDTPEPQEVELDGGAGATAVDVQVVSVYPSFTGTDAALTEIEFFTER